jgi:hypothetical protein
VLIEWVAIVGVGANQTIRSSVDNTGVESRFNKGDFMRRSTGNVDGDRKTSAVCRGYDLRTFAPLGLSHTAPFFGHPKGAVDEAFGQIEPATLVEMVGQGTEDPVENARAHPELEASMTGLIGRIARG